MAGSPNPGNGKKPVDHGETVNPPRDRKSGAGNPSPTVGEPEPKSVLTKLYRIADLAKESPQMAFTSLAHHIDVAWLHEAHELTRKDGAPGVDGQSAKQYEENLEANLQALLDRAKSGTYRAPAVRRVHIPKGSGPETRPIGIPTYEDKVLQRAVQMVLEAVYEQDFLDCSYGFRPGRSAHQALKRLWKESMAMGGCWLVEVDIQKFFDTLDHARLREILRQRIRDGVVLRLVGKWLNAGVFEDGRTSYPDQGTPQGGVISPLLANVYLHEVLDVWFERDIKPRLSGAAFLIRYADDFVMGFATEADARRVLDVLPKRFGKYGLTLHPAKTRLIDFRCPPRRSDRPDRDDDDESLSFDLLGFTHFWAVSKSKQWIVMRKTAKKRFARALSAISEWCRTRRHLSIEEQHASLTAKLRGHYAYYGIINNWRSLSRFRQEVRRIWRAWLSRRSSTSYVTWRRMTELLERYPLPEPRIVHTI